MFLRSNFHFTEGETEARRQREPAFTERAPGTKSCDERCVALDSSCFPDGPLGDTVTILPMRKSGHGKGQSSPEVTRAGTANARTGGALPCAQGAPRIGPCSGTGTPDPLQAQTPSRSKISPELLGRFQPRGGAWRSAARHRQGPCWAEATSVQSTVLRGGTPSGPLRFGPPWMAAFCLPAGSSPCSIPLCPGV